MKTILLAAIIALIPFGDSDAERTVFVCSTEGAKLYHLDKNCKKLSNCQTQIEEVTQKQAESKGLVLCEMEQGL